MLVLKLASLLVAFTAAGAHARFCSGSAPKCWDGAAPDPTESMPKDLTVCHLADQGLGADAGDVLRMCKNEGADAVIHAGDFSYNCRGDDWMDFVEGVLGSSFPYFAAGGNHDVDGQSSSGDCSDAWSNTKRGYQKELYEHNKRQGAKCEGEVGVNQVCTFKGLTIALSGVGSFGRSTHSSSDHVEFIKKSFEDYGGRWRVCAWHKNQRDMQLGGKGDSVGWAAYDTCREHGAWVQTGHEHSYARSYTMSNIEDKKLVNTNKGEVTLDEGKSFVAVSGVAGIDVRDCESRRDENPWWAQALCSNHGLKAGALICKYNYQGQADKARCYFKETNSPDGSVRDQFTITSKLPPHGGVAPPPPAGPPPPPSCGQEISVTEENDDAEQPAAGGDMYCDSSDLELVRDGDDQVIGVRFQGVNLDSSSMSQVSSVRISFTNDEARDETTNLVFHGDDTDNSQGFCSGNPDIISRTKTSARVEWRNLPAFTGSNQYSTPDLKGIVQEIVSRSGWRKGNAITFLISGSGKRVVDSYGTGTSVPPKLTIEANCGTGTPSPPSPPSCSSTSNCFNQRDSSGCDCSCVEQCVCSKDDYCCNNRWDRLCVARIGEFDCDQKCKVKAPVVVDPGMHQGCVPKTCSDYPGQCGAFPDGCGGITLPCTCANSLDTCSLSSTCRACVPKTCSMLGATCGTHDDGCGGQVSCGTCDSASEFCFDGRSCQPKACTPSQTCQPGQCGTLQVPCAGSAGNTTTVSCGRCSGRADCTATDLATEVGTCECVPTQTCGTRTCGTINDGCGNIVSCGTCPVNAPCRSSTFTCSPIGCGENQVLQAGACVCAPGFTEDPKSYECVAPSSVTSGAPQFSEVIQLELVISLIAVSLATLMG